MSAFVGEIIGTMILMLLGNGVVANSLLKNTKGHDSGLIIITAGWGMAVFVAVWVSAAASGAHLNPAVTIGLAAAGPKFFEWALVPTYIGGQILGAALGQILVWLAYRDHYNQTEDADMIRSTFCNTPAVRSYLNNTITEAVGTFVLVFAVLMAAPMELGNGEPIGLGALGALPVGLLVFGIGMSLGGPTGYAINPARDLIPRIVHAILPIPNKGGNDWAYAWVPVVGPILGGLAAAGLYVILS
ncbi:MAG: MIP/aquaporin family protein [Bacteroidota bacterium]